MHFKPLLIIVFISFMIVMSAFSQSDPKADSLLQLIENAEHDTIKVQKMLVLAEYYVPQPEKHLELAKEILAFSKRIRYTKGEGKAHATLGLYHTYRSNYPDALAEFDTALTVFREISDKASEVSVLGNVGNIYAYLGSYEDALKNYLEALEVMEDIGNKQWIATANNNIGNIYYFLDDIDNAMMYYQKALEVYRELESAQGMALALGNVGIIYNEKGNTDQAIIHLLEAVEYGQKANDPAQLAGNYSNLASSYGNKGMNDKAIDYYKKAVSIFKELGDKNGLSVAYMSMGEHYFRMKNYNSAKKYLTTAIEISEAISAKSNLMGAYRLEARIDSATGDYYSAYTNLYKYSDLRDLLFEEEKSKQIAEMQTRFDTKAKEKENLLLKEKEAKQEAVIKRKNYLTWFIVSMLLFMAVLAWLAFRNSNQQRKANHALYLKNTQINQQKEELKAQQENLAQANEEISEKNRLLHAVNENMTAGLNYAGHIQDAMMPGAHIFGKYFSEHFIIYRPKEIVSGDFFWLKETEDYLYFAAADCTGHGVPGAMVSMLGISYLNEIVARMPKIDTATILNELRTIIKDSLDKGSGQGRRDGLDIALCRLDFRTLELQYSGAHNPMYVYQGNDFVEFSADRMPIGKHRRERDFSSQSITLSIGDMIYLFSDGIVDQFGGKHEEKFKKVRLKGLLAEIYEKPLSEQKMLTENTFLRWKGNYPQLDDILVLGLKV